MKKLKLFSLFLFVLFFSSTSFVFALQTKDTKPTHVNRETKEEVNNLRQKTNENSNQSKSKRIEAVYQAIRNQLTQKYDLFNRIKTQVDAKIQQKQTEGKDVSKAQAKLTEFNKYITSYQTDLAAFDAQYQQLASATSKQSTYVSNMKKAADKVRLDLSSMRQTLTATLNILISQK